jgi:hypothetical protein
LGDGAGGVGVVVAEGEVAAAAGVGGPAFSGQLIKAISCCGVGVDVVVVGLAWGAVAEA